MGENRREDGGGRNIAYQYGRRRHHRVKTTTRAVAEEETALASGGAGQLSHFYDALTEGKADGSSWQHLFTIRNLRLTVANIPRERGISVRL